MHYLAPLLTALVLSYVFTPFSVKLASRWQFVDKPDERKVHLVPKPCLGGAAIFLSFLITSVIFVPLNQMSIVILSGATCFFAIGLADDRFILPAKWKFVLEIFFATAVVLLGIKYGFILANPFGQLGANSWLMWFSVPFYVLWIVGIANAVNLIDGLDGLASGVVLIACITLTISALINPLIGLNLLMLVLIGSLAGYIRYNLYPSKTIMGDSGSLVLGYLIAVIALVSHVNVQRSIFLSIIPPAMALLVPIMDTFVAMLRRGMNNRRLFGPDKNHIHHCLLHHGYSHPRAVLFVWSISSVSGVVSIAMGILIYRQVYIALVLLLVVLGWTLYSSYRMGLLSLVPDLQKNGIPYAKVAATSEQRNHREAK